MTAQVDHPVHLMVSGRIDAVEVRRGMLVVDESGETIAFLAGILIGDGETRATHLLLSRLPLNGDYRMVPVEWIQDVDLDRVCVCLGRDNWATLPRHEST